MFAETPLVFRVVHGAFESVRPYSRFSPPPHPPAALTGMDENEHDERGPVRGRLLDLAALLALTALSLLGVRDGRRDRALHRERHGGGPVHHLAVSGAPAATPGALIPRKPEGAPGVTGRPLPPVIRARIRPAVPRRPARRSRSGCRSSPAHRSWPSRSRRRPPAAGKSQDPGSCGETRKRRYAPPARRRLGAEPLPRSVAACISTLDVTALTPPPQPTAPAARAHHPHPRGRR